MLQSPFEVWPKLIQFARVFARKAAQNLPALMREVQDRAPPVAAVGFPRQQSFARGAIDKLDGAVVLQSKALGSVGNRDRRAIARTRDLQ